MSTLWCVHVRGPDELIAAPSKELAEEAASHMTKYFAQFYLPDDPKVSAVAVVWPFTPAGHAESVKSFYHETGLTPKPGVDHG